MNVTAGEIVAALGGTSGLAAICGYLTRAWVQGRKLARDVAVKTAEANAQVEVAEGRESTAQHKLDLEDAARVDSIAVDVAQAERAERIEAQHEHKECLEALAYVRIELAQCQKDHEHRAKFEDWVRWNMPRAPGTEPPPEPAPPRKPTPAGGTPRVQ